MPYEKYICKQIIHYLNQDTEQLLERPNADASIPKFPIQELITTTIRIFLIKWARSRTYALPVTKHNWSGQIGRGIYMYGHMLRLWYAFLSNKILTLFRKATSPESASIGIANAANLK